jgi:nucleoside-diphosphate-sugar epimerase
MGDAAQTDMRAIDVLGTALEGSGGPLLIASGTLGLTAGRVGTEQDMPDPGTHPRIANAAATLSFADRAVRAMVVRFAPTVHGTGDHGFVARLVAIAREKGESAYIGDGGNRWPAVHRFDAGALVALAVDRAAPGSVLHAVAEEGIATRDIAESIGRSLDLPVTSIPPDQAGAHFDWLGGFFGADCPASSAVTREQLGWTPTQPGLLADLDAGNYA